MVGGTEIKGWYLMDTRSGSSVDFTAQTTQDFRLDIGNAIWSKYNLIIDAKHNTLYLRRFEADSAMRPTYDYDFRNRTDIDAGWLVSSLYRDGNAANAGMALGDTIKAINGHPVTDYSWEEEYNLYYVPSMVLDIVGVDGQEKRIALEAKEMW